MRQSRRERPDYGTPELQAKRLRLVVNSQTGQAGDPAMAESEIGRLHEQGLLDQDPTKSRRMYDAGLTLLALWRAVFPVKGSSTLGRLMPAAGGEYDTERASDDLRSLRKFFGPMNGSAFNAALECVAYDTPQVGTRLALVRDGLTLIVKWQKQR